MACTLPPPCSSRWNAVAVRTSSWRPCPGTGSPALYVMRPTSRRPDAVFPLEVETSASGLVAVLVPLRSLLALIAVPLVGLRALRLRSLLQANLRVGGDSRGPDHTHASLIRQGPCRNQRRCRSVSATRGCTLSWWPARLIAVGWRVTLTRKDRRASCFFHGCARGTSLARHESIERRRACIPDPGSPRPRTSDCAEPGVTGSRSASPSRSS